MKKCPVCGAVEVDTDSPRTVYACGLPPLERGVRALPPERADGGQLLRVVPCDLKTANEFVRKLHRHSRPVVGHKFAVGVEACTRAANGESWALVGVAIVGRPVAPRLDNGKAAEVTRLCTDGTRNACSMLYGAARRAARALGHEPIYTYTLPDEGGASLRAAGFRLDKEDAGGSAAMWHSRPGRTAQPVGDDLIGGKWRWVG